MLRVSWDEPDEPGVEGQPAFAVAGAELSRPRLASYLDGQFDEVVRMPQGHRASRGIAHDPEHVRRHAHLVDDFGLERTDDRSVRADDVANDLRLVERAAVRESGICVDQLDRRHDVVALADPRLVRLTREDLVTESVLLPLIRWDDPGDLPGKVDPGRLAEAVLLRPIREPIDPELAGHLEEEGVAR